MVKFGIAVYINMIARLAIEILALKMPSSPPSSNSFSSQEYILSDRLMPLSLDYGHCAKVAPWLCNPPCQPIG